MRCVMIESTQVVAVRGTWSLQVVPLQRFHELPVAVGAAPTDLARLAAIVNPTLRHMRAILDGTIAPVPTQSYAAMCDSCQYRRRCSDWTNRPDAGET